MATGKTRKRRRRQAKPAQAPAKPARREAPSGGTPPAAAQSVLSFAGRAGVFTPAVGALILCLLVAVGYFPATTAGFVWDDVVLTGARQLQSVSGLWQIWFEPRSLYQYEGHYWPLLYTTFWLEHRLWGFSPLGYHVVNLLLHAAVALLLWRVLQRLEVPGAWVAAAVFAVHPVHVEPVVWVIGRKDLMATLFYLACVLAYVRFTGDGDRRHYALALVFFVLGFLCKSIMITLPAALLIFHWWKQGRVTGADVARVLPFFLLSLLIALADLSFYKSRDPTAFDYSWIERLLIAARVLWFYAGKLVWPADMAVIYPRWEPRADDLAGWAGIAAGVALVALLWVCRRRIGRGPLAGVLFFAAALAPVLGFVDYGYMLYSFVADRYQYLAGIGVIAVLVAAAARGLDRGPGLQANGRAVAAVGVAALLVVLGALTWRQAGIYRDNTTFYSHVVALNPQARFAHHSLGMEYQKQGRYEEALAAYQTDYRLALEQPSPQVRISKNYMSMGKTVEALGRPDEAEAYYRRAVENSPHYAGALESLAAFWIRRKQFQQALELFKVMLELEPQNARFYVGRGVALANLGRLDEAVQNYDKALSLDPLLQEAHTNRESILRFQRNQRR